MGRKKKSGPRGSTGRLLQMKDYGNPRVQARQELFRQFMGEAGLGHETSCAGRLMLVGAFDGMDLAPEDMLTALLQYQNAYWGNYAGGAKIGTYERADRSQDNGDHTVPDPRGEWFDALDRRLRNAGYQSRRAVHEATVDRHWFPDEDVSWAARIINTRFMAKGLPICGELAWDSDWAVLELLRAGALALAGGTMRRAA